MLDRFTTFRATTARKPSQVVIAAGAAAFPPAAQVWSLEPDSKYRREHGRDDQRNRDDRYPHRRREVLRYGSILEGLLPFLRARIDEAARDKTHRNSRHAAGH